MILTLRIKIYLVKRGRGERERERIDKEINIPLELHATTVRLAKGLCVVQVLVNFCRIASLYLVLKTNISMRRTI